MLPWHNSESLFGSPPQSSVFSSRSNTRLQTNQAHSPPLPLHTTPLPKDLFPSRPLVQISRRFCNAVQVESLVPGGTTAILIEILVSPLYGRLHPHFIFNSAIPLSAQVGIWHQGSISYTICAISRA